MSRPAIEFANRSGVAVDERAMRELVVRTLAAEGIADGDVGLAAVSAAEMAALNATHRGKPEPTDVLSFPIDGGEALETGLPRQLGDVVICPQVAETEGTPVEVLVVHGLLHLLGYDHEADDGRMLTRQAELVAPPGG